MSKKNKLNNNDVDLSKTINTIWKNKLTIFTTAILVCFRVILHTRPDSVGNYNQYICYQKNGH